MAKKIGICRNIDCDNYKKTIEVEPGVSLSVRCVINPCRKLKVGGKKG